MKKLLTSITTTAAVVLALPAIAFAHVVVTPNQAGVATRTLFNVSVPNEEKASVTSLKLDIPEGMSDVQPTVMAGWKITTEKNGDDVVSITWTGDIPEGQRADLTFKGQTPSKATDLNWKAYQTYDNGKVVSWDQKPSSGGDDDESSTSGPYSVTKIINDIDTANDNTQDDLNTRATAALILSVVALIFSLGALFLRRSK